MNRIILLILAIFLFGCKSPEARPPISQSSGTFIKESAERNKKLFEREQKQIESIISTQEETEFQTSKSGFWYYYNTKIEEESVHPKFGDIVNFNYNIKDLNGKIIYSETELKTQNYAMDQQELFTGLREGLKLMKAGETVTFLFPSQKAYGYYGDEDRIGTNIPIICEVTINMITQKETD